MDKPVTKLVLVKEPPPSRMINNELEEMIEHIQQVREEPTADFRVAEWANVKTAQSFQNRLRKAQQEGHPKLDGKWRFSARKIDGTSSALWVAWDGPGEPHPTVRGRPSNGKAK